MSYWAMRTAKEHPEFFWNELKAGRLRQGWGYDSQLDLRVLSKEVESRELEDWEQRCWRGNRRLLPDEDDAITEDDIVVVPNLPMHGRWSIVRIEDNDYEFDIDPDLEDFGHIRHVELLTDDRGIHPYAEAVDARLRGSLKRCLLRLWSLDKHHAAVDRLLEALKQGENLHEPVDETQHLIALHEETRQSLLKELKRRFRAEEVEGPVGRLLEQVYDDVEQVGGRGERGADFVCHRTDDLGVTSTVTVQVKMKFGQTSLDRGLNQLRKANRHYDNVTAGVLLTMLDSVGDTDRRKREELEKDLEIPIVVLTKEEVLDLFLRLLPELVSSEDVA